MTQKEVARRLGVAPRYLRLIKEGKRSGAKYEDRLARLWASPKVQQEVRRIDSRTAPRGRREAEPRYLKRIAKQHGIKKLDVYEVGEGKRPKWGRRPSQVPRRKATDWYASFRVLTMGIYEGRMTTRVYEFIWSLGLFTRDEFAARREQIMERAMREATGRFRDVQEVQLIDVFAHGAREYE